jgi:hypothetical protein
MIRPELMCPVCERKWQEGRPVHLTPSPGLAEEGYFVADECDHWPTSDPACGENLDAALADATERLLAVMGRIRDGERRGLRADVSEARIILDMVESWSGKVLAFDKPVPGAG